MGKISHQRIMIFQGFISSNNVAGMTVKNTENYVKADCGLPADTFNIIVLQNNRLNQSEEKN